jgi:hypothetical protein
LSFDNLVFLKKVIKHPGWIGQLKFIIGVVGLEPLIAQVTVKANRRICMADNSKVSCLQLIKQLKIIGLSI